MPGSAAEDVAFLTRAFRSIAGCAMRVPMAHGRRMLCAAVSYERKKLIAVLAECNCLPQMSPRAVRDGLRRVVERDESRCVERRIGTTFGVEAACIGHDVARGCE